MIRKETDRFKKFTNKDIEKGNYNLDILWLKDIFSTQSSNMPDPLSLEDEAAVHLETALDSVKELLVKLRNYNKME